MSRTLFACAALIGLAGCAAADPSFRQGNLASTVQGRQSPDFDDGMDRPPARQRPGVTAWDTADNGGPSDAFSFIKAWNLPPSHWEIYSGR